jgi:hypothetical protein
MGGGVLFRSLLDSGQVDGVEVGLVPVLLVLHPGEGKRIRTLTGSRQLPSGMVKLS